MDDLIKKYESGWLLSVLRCGPALNNKWYFLSPEDANKPVDYETMESMNYKKVRNLIHKSRVVFDSVERNQHGLPLVTVYTHKNLSV